MARARNQGFQGPCKTQVVQMVPKPLGVKMRLAGSEVYNRTLQRVKITAGKRHLTHHLTMTANQVRMVNKGDQDQFVGIALNIGQPSPSGLAPDRHQRLAPREFRLLAAKLALIALESGFRLRPEQ